MGFRVEAEMRGLSECIAKLGHIDKRIQRSVTRKAVNAGGRELVKTTKANAPRDTGLLRRKITQRIKTYRRKVLAVIGARKFKDAKTGRNAANYAHLVEDGARPHRIAFGVFVGSDGERKARRIEHPGARATHFMRRSARQATPAAVRRFKTKFLSDLLMATR